MKHSEAEQQLLVCTRCQRGILTWFHALPMENEALVYSKRREDSYRIGMQLPQDILLTEMFTDKTVSPDANVNYTHWYVLQIL